jgi:hypothetical protein
MRRVTWAVVASAMMALPAVAQAQRMQAPRTGEHEIGVDVALSWAKPSGGTGVLEILTPVDVRVGFPSRGPLSLEPRFSMRLLSGGGTIYTIDPGVNVLYKLNGTAVNRNTYLTGGADLDFVKAGVSGTVFGLNGGFGMRHPWGAGAFRTEIFAHYAFKNTNLGAPNTFSFGVRLGLSLWH